jgi:hypothetical protein
MPSRWYVVGVDWWYTVMVSWWYTVAVGWRRPVMPAKHAPAKAGGPPSMCGRPVGFKGGWCRKTGGGYECDHVSGLAVRYR